jgi:HAD superfamily hydrolase (TIGR01549 family)
MNTRADRAYEAVFLDALGTIVELEPPWRHLATALGLEQDERLVAAVRTEMDYYRAHSHEGRDEGSLADLRRRCAEVLSSAIGTEVSVETMMSAIRFHAFADAVPALQALRAQGIALVCVSNWDCSLAEVLARVGLGQRLDGVVTSAQAGARKPDPKIFEPALELAGCEPERALHVGDTEAEDRAGAAAAGIDSLLLDRDGGAEIASLEEIAGRVRQHAAP